ncbi:hypothetical protein [Gracilimonas tropica]|uniref:hypothetical protein n=1 Tax=Gracilimonas tropica TaxID=454600 RepID=UPI00035CC2B7|nr:hypothetical protein [Gracilimonas tropica]
MSKQHTINRINQLANQSMGIGFTCKTEKVPIPMDEKEVYVVKFEDQGQLLKSWTVETGTGKVIGVQPQECSFYLGVEVIRNSLIRGGNIEFVAAGVTTKISRTIKYPIAELTKEKFSVPASWKY